ncbi:PI-PLC X domain-containing protein 1 [Calliopsis andreniformis]|uniref:PI-PLC X domain-containing protein 1 n=1 Tax=Calliopsis andreniformis TaxID=337506 RepID=UPI003FCC9EF5
MARSVELLVLAYLLMIVNVVSAGRVCNSSQETWQSRIGILVSPIISKSLNHELEVYWNNVNFQSGEKIIVKHDSPVSTIPTLSITPRSSSRVVKSGIKIKFLPSANLSFVPKHIFHISRQSPEGDIKEVNSMKTNPTWMKERQHILGPLRMSQIFLPGTHDSASYPKDNDTGNIVTNFAVTQNLDILSQLIHGVRYLDIRVGHYPDTPEIWWTNHGPYYRSVPVNTVLEHVKRFLDNTEEILVMDMREFPVGFDNITIHQNFVSYLENELCGYFLPKNSDEWRITLNDIWSSGKRLIIGYDNVKIAQEHASMWPCVQHQWGDVRSLEDLYTHLSKIESNDRSDRVRPRSAMAQLTPNFLDIVTNRLGTLRDMAYRVNLNVTNWYSTIWQYSANIVAVDFVRGTGIIETAIAANENRHLHCQY